MNITAKYLTKVYSGGVYALDGFSVDIEHGSVVAVLGESGCGKTTLLRLLSGLEKPTAGELYFDGVLFKDVPIKQRDTAIVFQDYVLYPKMTVWENVATALERYDLPRDEEERRVGAVLKELDIYKLRNQLPRVFSGGQQQRVALARAIVRDPSLLLFDEPLSNVAEEQRTEYIRLILKLKQRLPRTTFVYVTHNPREAMAVGDCLLVMSEGKCLQYGRKERVWKYPYSADVLRTIWAEPREISGTVQSGVFTPAGGGDEYTFDTSYNGDATVIFNPYDDHAPCLFDEKGNAACGEKHTAFLSGTFDGEPAVVRFGGTSFTPDDDFVGRFIGKRGKVKVGIQSNAFKFTRTGGDIEIAAERVGGDVYTVCGEKLCLFGGEKFDGHLYVDPASVELYDNNGKRTLAHYIVYNEPHAARCSGGKLKTESGAIDCDIPGGGRVEFVFNSKAKITPTKKGGLKAECLDEEDIGGERLVYAALKGYSHYVTFRAAPYERFFGVKKLKITVDPDGITVIKQSV